MSFGSSQHWQDDNMHDTDSPEIADEHATEESSSHQSSVEVVDLAGSESPSEQHTNAQISSTHAPVQQQQQQQQPLPSIPPWQSNTFTAFSASSSNVFTSSRFGDSTEAVQALEALETYRGSQAIGHNGTLSYSHSAETAGNVDNEAYDDEDDDEEAEEYQTGEYRRDEQSDSDEIEIEDEDLGVHMNTGANQGHATQPKMADKVEFPDSRRTSATSSKASFETNTGDAISTKSLEESDLSDSSRASPEYGAEKAHNLHQIRSGIDASVLKAQIRDLEMTQWELERKLNQAQLQCDASRQQQQRQAVLAEEEAEELRQLRTNSAREKAQLESRIVELNMAASASKIEQESREKSFAMLRERFSTQSATLGELRQQLVSLEKNQLESEAEMRASKQSESRLRRQLEQLRQELNVALEDAAQARAELDVQISTMSEMRAQARAEALAALEEDLPAQNLIPGGHSADNTFSGNTSTISARQSLNGGFESADDEQIWRSRYVALRKEMDDVAAEFEQREPQISALQAAYDDAEARLTAAQDELSQQQEHQAEFERKYRLAERRSADLAVYQQLSEKQLDNSRRQVLVLLTDKALSSSDENPSTPEEEDELVRLREEVARSDAESREQEGVTNGEKSITERLSLFKDVAELQFQNEALLKACRELASQLDPQARAQTGAIKSLESQKSEDSVRATEALEDLQAKFVQSKTELSDVSLAKDNVEKASVVSESASTHLKERIAELETKLRETSLRVADESTNLGNSQPQNLNSNIDERLLKLKLKAAEDRVEDLRSEAAQYRDEARMLSNDLSRARHDAGKAEQGLIHSQQICADSRAQSANHQHTIANLQKENQLLMQREQQLMLQLSQAETEATEAKRQSENSQRELKTQQETLASARIEQNVSGNGRNHSDNAKKDDKFTNTNDLEGKSFNKIAKLEQLISSQRQGKDSAISEVTEISDTSAHHKLQESQARISELESKIHSLESELSSSHSNETSVIEDSDRIKQTLESQISSLKVNANQSESQVSELSGKLGETEKEMKEQAKKAHHREQELIEQVNDLEDQITEIQIKAENESKKNEDLQDKISQQAGELSRALQHVKDQKTQYEEQIANYKSDSTSQTRVEGSANDEPLESKKMSMKDINIDVSSIPDGDVDTLKARLSEWLPQEVIARFESDISQAEQNRTKDLFKQKSDETRANAQKLGEEKASKRAEMRTKLQTQKLQKSENRNQDLERQVEQLRNKVRRLKGGETVDDAEDSGQMPQSSQKSSQLSRPNSNDHSSSETQPSITADANQSPGPSIDPSNSSIYSSGSAINSFMSFPPAGADAMQSFATNPFQQVFQQDQQQRTTSPFQFVPSVFEASKRMGQFEDNESKKRKEE